MSKFANKLLLDTLHEEVIKRVPKPSIPENHKIRLVSRDVSEEIVKVSPIINVGNEKEREPESLGEVVSMFPKPRRGALGSAQMDFTDKPMVYREAVKRLPAIIEMVEEHLRPKLIPRIVQSWKPEEVGVKRIKIADDLINLISKKVDDAPPGSAEDLDMIFFRMCFTSNDAFLQDLLRQKMDEMVTKVIVELRGNRVPTISDFKMSDYADTEPAVKIDRVIAELDRSDILSEEISYDNLKPKTMLPPAMPTGKNRNNMASLNSIAEELQCALNDVYKQPSSNSNDTSEIDELWDEIEIPDAFKPISGSAVHAQSLAEIDEGWDSIATVEKVNVNSGVMRSVKVMPEILTADDIIGIEDPRTKHDSLAPVVKLYPEEGDDDFDDDIDTDDYLVALIGSKSKTISKYRFLFSAAALALLVGGTSALIQKANSSETEMNVASVMVDDTPKQPTINTKGKRPAVKTPLNASEKKEFEPVISDSTAKKIKQIPDEGKRAVFEKMFLEGKFDFKLKDRNTVDQLLLPFYSLATPQQKKQLDQVAKNFNTGLYASATKRFGGIGPSEKTALLKNGNSKNTDAHVYRALATSKYGDPSTWNANFKGKRYSDVFNSEMKFYERFENEMAVQSDCPRVFQSESAGERKIFDPGNGRYNAVIEAAAKVVFGSDFYQMRPVASTSENIDDEIPVVWDLNEFQEHKK